MVRQRSAKPSFTSSNLVVTSTTAFKCKLESGFLFWGSPLLRAALWDKLKGGAPKDGCLFGGCSRKKGVYFLWTPKESTKERRRYFRGAGHGQGDPSPRTPKKVGRGRAGLKNRQDTFFDAPPTRSRLTAPPIKFAGIAIFIRLFPFYGWFVGNGLSPRPTLLPEKGLFLQAKSGERPTGAPHFYLYFGVDYLK